MKAKLLIFASLLVVSSCTMDKKIYSPGWHVEWMSKKQHSVENKQGTEICIEEKNAAIQQKSAAFKAENSAAAESNAKSIAASEESEFTASADKAQRIVKTQVKPVLNIVHQKKNKRDTSAEKKSIENPDEKKFPLLRIAAGIMLACILLAALSGPYSILGGVFLGILCLIIFFALYGLFLLFRKIVRSGKKRKEERKEKRKIEEANKEEYAKTNPPVPEIKKPKDVRKLPKEFFWGLVSYLLSGICAGAAIGGLWTSWLAFLIIPAAFFSILAITLSVLSLNKINKSSEKFKGKGWAIMLLFLGVWAIVIIGIAILALLLSLAFF